MENFESLQAKLTGQPIEKCIEKVAAATKTEADKVAAVVGMNNPKINAAMRKMRLLNFLRAWYKTYHPTLGPAPKEKKPKKEKLTIGEQGKPKWVNTEDDAASPTSQAQRAAGVTKFWKGISKVHITRTDRISVIARFYRAGNNVHCGLFHLVSAEELDEVAEFLSLFPKSIKIEIPPETGPINSEFKWV